MPYDDVKKGGKAKADPLDEVEDTAAADVAAALGVEDADVPALKGALIDIIRACIKREAAEETEEE